MALEPYLFCAVRFLQPVVAQIISTLRAPKSAEGYRSIGGGSPLRRITEEQGEALATALRNRDINASCYVGMRYWKPFTEEAVAKVFLSYFLKLSSLPCFFDFKSANLLLLNAICKGAPSIAFMWGTCIKAH